mmetsp:Transcript_23879/g.73095  ORF Transcript_23879/g.73095 Transcript_23879/m.73095 type:complete len:86 (+) Transcript_23879:824-1081(+)|eukprot:scaffold320223_cov27-Tisochrysis_lutea.AAC.1
MGTVARVLERAMDACPETSEHATVRSHPFILVMRDSPAHLICESLILICACHGLRVVSMCIFYMKQMRMHPRGGRFSPRARLSTS